MKRVFHPLAVKEIRRETVDTVSIAFDVPAELQADYRFVSGQYLTLKGQVDGQEVRRSYSICSAPSERELRVAVKQIQDGRFSTYANRVLKEGDVLDVMVPEGNFTVRLAASSKGSYVFYAAGSGITPILSMIQSLLETAPDSSVFLYYGNRTVKDIIFKEQLDRLAAAFSQFRVTYILSREDAGEPIRNGRIDEEKCHYFHQNELEALPLEGIYVCGPEAMVAAIQAVYREKGLSDKVHFELFTAPSEAFSSVPTESAEEEVTDANVTVTIDDEDYTFSLSTGGKDILSAAQDHEIDVPFSCKGGVCCTCRAKVMEGEVKMALNFSLEEEEVAEGYVLTCQSHPITEKVVISFDE